ncbi:MAG: TIGR00730 family Rossman fold protein [Candidatus Pacebacteria bacterium]|nr:TIGR00730 family Rossman fold protein [Candidatus Paceibacterota bacterium]
MTNNIDKESNVSDSDFSSTKEDFKKTFPWRIFKIMAEFIEGFEFISNLKDKSVTVFGATRFLSDNSNYQKAEKLGALLSKEGYTVITGGGPGIMEAANKGAYEAGGESAGINIELPESQESNRFVNKSSSFHYFFIRKMIMSFASSVYLFFPGGYGTLDEFFEMVMLLQTKKLSQPVTIVAVGKDYWEPLFRWFKDELYEKQKAISEGDLKLFKLVDTPEEAVEYIKSIKNIKK